MSFIKFFLILSCAVSFSAFGKKPGKDARDGFYTTYSIGINGARYYSSKPSQEYQFMLNDMKGVSGKWQYSKALDYVSYCENYLDGYKQAFKNNKAVKNRMKNKNLTFGKVQSKGKKLHKMIRDQAKKDHGNWKKTNAIAHKLFINYCGYVKSIKDGSVDFSY